MSEIVRKKSYQSMKISHETAFLQMLFLVVVAFVLKKGKVVGLNTQCTSTGGFRWLLDPYPAALSLFSLLNRTGEKIRWKSLC